MNWKSSFSRILMALVFPVITIQNTQSRSKEARIVAEERQEDLVSQKRKVEEVRQYFLDHQQLYKKRDVKGIIGAHDIEFLSQLPKFKNRNPKEGRRALLKQVVNYSDRIFKIIANAEIDSVELAPQEIRSACNDNNLYLVFAADSSWLFRDTDEGWKTLGADFEGEIAEEMSRLNGSNKMRRKKAAASLPLPRIVTTSPDVAVTEVDPSIGEITVTFNRDMGTGMSWTGGEPYFPEIPDGTKAYWRDERTCILPVQLDLGKYYRVGINSTNHYYFKSTEGVPAKPSVLYFTTRGASDELLQNIQRPLIVGLIPLNEAKNVDPNLHELRVTFNIPMGEGFSWMGSGSSFPAIPKGMKPYWTQDRKTCVLPVQLKPNWYYHLGLNRSSHINFQSEGGVPVEPVIYTFTTSN